MERFEEAPGGVWRVYARNGLGDRDEAARINGSVGWTAAIAARPLQVDMDRVRIAEWLC